MVHIRRAVTRKGTRNIWTHAHCGHPLQSVANRVYAADQSIRAITFTITLGGAYVDQFPS